MSFGGSFSKSKPISGPDFRKKAKTTATGENDQFLPGPNPAGFQLQSSKFLQAGNKGGFNPGALAAEAGNTALDQMQGKNVSLDAQEAQQQDALKVAQARRTRNLREQMLQQGVNTGKLLEEGVINTARADERERTALDREQLAQRAQFEAQQRAQGQQSAQNLLSMFQQGQISREQLDNEMQRAQMSDATTRRGQDIQVDLSENALSQQEKEFSRQLDATLRGQDIEKYIADNQLTQREAESLRNLGIERDKLANDRFKFVTGLDFQETQADLDRDQQLAMEHLDQAGQTALAELQGKIQDRQILNAQSFEATQNELARLQQLAVQQNDIAAQENIAKLQATLAEKAATAQRAFQKGERIATQIYSSGERFSEQQFQQAFANQQFRYNEALQRNDIESAERIANEGRMLELKKQTNAMNHDEKMLELQDRYQAAQADDDLVRQKSIAEFMHRQDMSKFYKQTEIDDRRLEEQHRRELENIAVTGDLQKDLLTIEQEFADAQANKDVNRQRALMRTASALKKDEMSEAQKDQIELLTKQIDGSMREQGMVLNAQRARQFAEQKHQALLQKNDIVSAEKLHKATLEEQFRQAFKQEMLAEARLKLEEKGIDMAATEAEYNRLASAAQQGLIKSDAPLQYLQQQMGGINLEAVDKWEQTRKALDADFEATKLQWAQTHNTPDLVSGTDEFGRPILTAKGQEKFFEQVNAATFGEDTSDAFSVANQIALGEKSLDSLTDEDITALENSADTAVFSGNRKRVGKGSSATERLAFLDDLGTNGIFRLPAGETKDLGNGVKAVGDGPIGNLPSGVYQYTRSNNVDVFGGRDATDYFIKSMKTGQEYRIRASKDKGLVAAKA